jgi:hypothetical protein
MADDRTKYPYWHRSLQMPCRVVKSPPCNAPSAPYHIAIPRGDGKEEHLVVARCAIRVRPPIPPIPPLPKE